MHDIIITTKLIWQGLIIIMISHNKKQLGDLGESLAQSFLLYRGYTILEKNFRCKFEKIYGEIDIIAKDQEFICFVEVKTRFGNIYSSPAESVTLFKQKKIAHVAQLYLLKKKLTKYNARFDVVELIFHKDIGNYSIKLIKDAFYCDL